MLLKKFLKALSLPFLGFAAAPAAEGPTFTAPQAVTPPNQGTPNITRNKNATAITLTSSSAINNTTKPGSSASAKNATFIAVSTAPIANTATAQSPALSATPTGTSTAPATAPASRVQHAASRSDPINSNPKTATSSRALSAKPAANTRDRPLLWQDQPAKKTISSKVAKGIKKGLKFGKTNNKPWVTTSEGAAQEIYEIIKWINANHSKDLPAQGAIWLLSARAVALDRREPPHPHLAKKGIAKTTARGIAITPIEALSFALTLLKSYPLLNGNQTMELIFLADSLNYSPPKDTKWVESLLSTLTPIKSRTLVTIAIFTHQIAMGGGQKGFASPNRLLKAWLPMLFGHKGFVAPGSGIGVYGGWSMEKVTEKLEEWQMFILIDGVLLVAAREMRLEKQR